jgi:tRNA(Ile)-lysidine synthase
MRKSILAARLATALQRQFRIRAGERIAVAVSGGADSVALLLLLLELREKLGFVLVVAHFNHKLRGRFSDADEKFVAQLASRHALEFHAASANVAGNAKKERANLEDAARRARYSFFQSLVDSGRCSRVAVAHTADDQAETVLAHILRGTGLAGLGGIHPAAGCVFRPLLGVRRKELRAYLKQRQQPWREDATNLDLTRMRARIRARLLPLIEKTFQPAVARHLSALAAQAREDEALLAALAEDRIASLAKKDQSGLRIPAADLLRPWGSQFQHAPAISKRMLKRLVESVKTRPGQLTAHHLDAALDLAGPGHGGKTLQLPGEIEIRRELDDLLIRPRPSGPALPGRKTAAGEQPLPSYSYPLRLDENGATLRVLEIECAFRFMVIDWPAKRRETSKDGAVVLDLGRLDGPLVLRNCGPGDRFQPAGRGRSHKLKRLLLEKRLGRWERAAWPVLTSGGAIAWVRGLPAAAQFAPDARTRKAVVITEEKL